MFGNLLAQAVLDFRLTMKKLLLILFCLPIIGFGQSVPQGINYQAVARDANASHFIKFYSPNANTPIFYRIGLKNGSNKKIKGITITYGLN